MAKRKSTKYNGPQEIKHWATRTPLKTEGELKFNIMTFHSKFNAF